MALERLQKNLGRGVESLQKEIETWNKLREGWKAAEWAGGGGGAQFCKWIVERPRIFYTY
jgi:hypothetical protein